MIFFTSITSNYLPKAIVLADSVRRHQPDARFYLLLCDTPPANGPDFAKSFDRVFLLQDLAVPVPNLEQWVFHHTVVELCTAVKGPFLLQALDQLGADKVVYLDPDIVVLDSLRELEALLEAHSIIVTPHLAEPDSSLTAIRDNEICALKHGVFNLGFLAVRNSPEGRRFARWWCERLVHFCYDDIPNGLFTDQRWIDLAPAFFSDFHILRDKTYNVATWNLCHRRAEKGGQGKLCIEGAPIKFFHFSGFDSGAQLEMLKKYGGHSPALFELRQWYSGELERAGQGRYGKLSWGYDCFSNGQPIRPEYRRLYRDRVDLVDAFPRPALAEEGRPSYYQWCVDNFSKSQVPRRRLPLLQRWKRSIKKRLPFNFNRPGRANPAR
jgi:hypothetical protein